MAEVVPWLRDKFEVVFAPPLPGSEQFSLQQRRAIEVSGAIAVDLAFLQQRGIFLSTGDASAALAPIAVPSRMTTIAKLKILFSMPGNYI